MLGTLMTHGNTLVGGKKYCAFMKRATQKSNGFLRAEFAKVGSALDLPKAVLGRAASAGVSSDAGPAMAPAGRARLRRRGRVR